MVPERRKRREPNLSWPRTQLKRMSQKTQIISNAALSFLFWRILLNAEVHATCSETRCESTSFTYYDSDRICSERDADPLPSCYGGGNKVPGTYADVLAFCTDEGLRLCTYAELYLGAGVGTGCSTNNLNVWSSETCDLGDGSALSFILEEHDESK